MPTVIPGLDSNAVSFLLTSFPFCACACPTQRTLAIDGLTLFLNKRACYQEDDSNTYHTE